MPCPIDHALMLFWQNDQAWASECALEVAVPPVAASAYWSLHSAAAMVATRLGTTLRYILQQHSMWHMAQARPVTASVIPLAAPKHASLSSFVAV